MSYIVRSCKRKERRKEGKYIKLYYMRKKVLKFGSKSGNSSLSKGANYDTNKKSINPRAENMLRGRAHTQYVQEPRFNLWNCKKKNLLVLTYKVMFLFSFIVTPECFMDSNKFKVEPRGIIYDLNFKRFYSWNT